MITSFLKKWHKKRLLKQIYSLKVEAARLNSYALTSKSNVEESKSYLETLKNQSTKNSGVFNYLTLYLDSHLQKIQRFEAEYASYNQGYLNTLDQIKRLEEELNKL